MWHEDRLYSTLLLTNNEQKVRTVLPTVAPIDRKSQIAPPETAAISTDVGLDGANTNG